MIRFVSMPRSIASLRAARQRARRRRAGGGRDREVGVASSTMVGDVNARSNRADRAGNGSCRRRRRAEGDEPRAGSWSRRSATPGTRFPAIALARALARARPRGRGRDLGALARGGRGRRARLHRGRGVHDFPAAAPARRSGDPRPRTRRWRCCRCSRRCDPTSSSATSSRWRRRSPPSAPGVRRATLIPHVYPVHEPGLPFFAFGALPPRTPVGRALWRAALPVLRRRAAARARRAQRDARAARPARRSSASTAGSAERAGAGRDLPAARVPAPLAGRGPGHRADVVRAALPGHRAAAGRRAAGPGGAAHRAGPRLPAGAGGARGARGRAGAGAWRRPTGTRRPSRCRRPRRTRCSSTGSATRRRWPPPTWSSATAATARSPGRSPPARRCSAARRSATWPRTARGSPGRAPG